MTLEFYFIVVNYFFIFIFVFIFGLSYRIFRYIMLYRYNYYSVKKLGVGKILLGLTKTFEEPIYWAFETRKRDLFFGLFIMHIVGLIPLIFLLAPHVSIFSSMFPPYGVLKPLELPLSFNQALNSSLYGAPPGLVWGPLVVVLNGDVLALLSMLGASAKIGMKLHDAARGERYVRSGDLLAWPLLLGILITGFMAAHHIGNYGLVLGLHAFLAGAFIAVLPFTKFFHFLWGFWFGKLHEWYDQTLKRGAV